MNNFSPQKYATSLKRIIPEGYKLQKEAVTLLSSIIFDINTNFTKVVLTKTKRVEEISAKTIEESISSIIPKELKRYALAAGNNAVFNYHSGLIAFKVPKLQKDIILETRILRKGLEVLATTAHRNLTLSKDCTTISGIMQNIAVHFAENSIDGIQYDPESSLRNLKNLLEETLGSELFHHVQGHAERNLEWYRHDQLDFTLKTFYSQRSQESVESKIFAPSVQKLAKSQYNGLLVKDALGKVENFLKGALNETLLYTGQHVQPNVTDGITISENDIYQSVKNLLPKALFRSASAHAQANVMNYHLGGLKYQYKQQPKQAGVGSAGVGSASAFASASASAPVPSAEVIAEEPVIANYRKGVKRMMEDCRCTAAKGFLGLMNEMLNDLCIALVEKCSESAQSNDILTENDVFYSVNLVLPQDLRKHAFARIYHLQNDMILPTRQISETLLSIPSAQQIQKDAPMQPLGEISRQQQQIISGFSRTSCDTILSDVNIETLTQEVPFSLSKENGYAKDNIEDRPDIQIVKSDGILPLATDKYSATKTDVGDELKTKQSSDTEVHAEVDSGTQEISRSVSIEDGAAKDNIEGRPDSQTFKSDGILPLATDKYSATDSVTQEMSLSLSMENGAAKDNIEGRPDSQTFKSDGILPLATEKYSDTSSVTQEMSRSLSKENGAATDIIEDRLGSQTDVEFSDITEDSSITKMKKGRPAMQKKVFTPRKVGNLLLGSKEEVEEFETEESIDSGEQGSKEDQAPVDVQNEIIEPEAAMETDEVQGISETVVTKPYTEEEKLNEQFMLDIPRPTYWLDCRPFDISV